MSPSVCAQRDGDVQILVRVDPDRGGGDHGFDGGHDGDGLLLADRQVGGTVDRAGGQDCDEAPSGAALL